LLWYPCTDRQRYQQSKLANLLFTYALHDFAQAKQVNVKSLCAHPGATNSGLQTKVKGQGILDNYILNSTLLMAHSTEDGTMGLALAAIGVKSQSGQFYGPGPDEFADHGAYGPAMLLPEERDPAAERMLWNESIKAANTSGVGPVLPGLQVSEGQRASAGTLVGNPL
jgi:NAD(P)-dependent dehydrogenase (short-subunit alcohol dehydrogenase family)